MISRSYPRKHVSDRRPEQSWEQSLIEAALLLPSVFHKLIETSSLPGSAQPMLRSLVSATCSFVRNVSNSLAKVNNVVNEKPFPRKAVERHLVSANKLSSLTITSSLGSKEQKIGKTSSST